MSSIHRATQKARRERERRAWHGDETPAKPILTPVAEDSKRPAPARAKVMPMTPSERKRAAFPFELLDGRFGPPEPHLVSLLSPESMESEHYQSIRFALERERREGATIIAVTSASPGEGKTITTLNLAGCLARNAEAKVLVMDGDLRNPSVADYLQMRSQGPGLSGALTRAERSLSDVARLHRHYNLAVVPSGDVSNVPYELFTSPQMKALVEEAREGFDYVFIDLPPMLFAECRVLERYVDWFVVVVTAHRTSRTQLRDGLDQFDRSKILGLVFNADTHRKSRIPSYYKYGYKRS